MKLVIFVAAGLAFVSVTLRDSGSGYMATALFSGVAVPLLWVALTFILFRRGPHRERAVIALLLISVSSTLVAVLSVVWSIANHILAIPAGIAVRKDALIDRTIAAAVTLVSTFAWVFLLLKLLHKMKKPSPNS